MSDINGLEDALVNKSDKDHTYEIADVNDLQTTLDEKVTTRDLDEAVSTHSHDIPLF